MQAQPYKKYIVVLYMNLVEARLSFLIEIYQVMVRSLFRRYDIESDKEEREKIMTEVHDIIEAVHNLQP